MSGCAPTSDICRPSSVASFVLRKPHRLSSGCTETHGVISRSLVNLIMCTGAYLPFRHDRQLGGASSFEIGVFRGRPIASNGVLACGFAPVTRRSLWRNGRMHVMRKLPVVPICRTSWPLRCRANQNEHPRVPPPIRGALRDRHERWKRDAMDAVSHETNEMIADGEVV
jgi:hypothetical protein